LLGQGLLWVEGLFVCFREGLQMDSDWGGSLFSKEEWAELKESLSLSPQQARIASYLISGLSDKQIAARMRIAVPTVRTYLHRLFEKYHVQDRHGLIIYIFSQFRKYAEKSVPSK
jgi:DNA-binding NarL/FixJ family response regulator